SCVQAVGADGSVSNCAENTIPARALAVDPTTFSLNFLYSCSTVGENLQHPPYGPLHDYYLAQSTDGGLTWTTHPVFVAGSSGGKAPRSEEHTSELQSLRHLVCRLLLEKKKQNQ